MIDRIKNFFEAARLEFRHVQWPTRSEAIRLTSIVIVLSLGLALFLGLFDYLFSALLRFLVSVR